MNKAAKLLEKILFRKKKTFLERQKDISRAAFKGFVSGMEE